MVIFHTVKLGDAGLNQPVNISSLRTTSIRRWQLPNSTERVNHLTYQLSACDVQSLRLVTTLRLDGQDLISTKQMDKRDISHYTMTNQL